MDSNVSLADSRLPTWRLILSLALPVLAQQSLVFAVMQSDRFLAGHLATAGEQQPTFQAAQTTANYLAWLISSYTVTVTVGSIALVARFIGAGDRPLANQVMHQAMILATGLAVVGSVVALAGGLPWIIDLLNLDGDAAELAHRYLRPLFFLLVFQMLESAGIACLVGAGDTKTGLWVMLGVALVNLPLAWGFVRGWPPLPEIGFVGIALGTALSHALGGMAVLIVLARGRYGLKLRWKQLVPRWDLLARLLRVSVPAALDSLSVVAGQFWFLAIVNQLGYEASSAHGIALGWEALGYLSGAAFGTAAMTLVGQNLGAQQSGRAARAGWTAFGIGCGVMCVMGAIFFILAEPMFRLYCTSPSQAGIVAAGVPVLRLVAFAMPAAASTFILTQALRGAGDTRFPLLFTWVGFCAVRIPCAYFFSFDELHVPLVGEVAGLGLGLLGAWLAMFADLMVRGVFFLHRFAGGRWQRVRV